MLDIYTPIMIVAGLITYDAIKWIGRRLFTRRWGENGKWWQGGRS